MSVETYGEIREGKCVNIVVASELLARARGLIKMPAGYGVGDLFDGIAWTKAPEQETVHVPADGALAEALAILAGEVNT